MTIVMDGLRYLAYILIFPGFLFCFLTGMLLCGIDRKLVARMQKRIGPPILQPFYDFFKLLGKETIVPAAANRTVFLLAPLVGLAAQVVLQLFIPVFHFNAFRGVADVIVILYLLLIPALSVILGAASSGSPYAGVGLSREMVTVLSVELPLVLVLLAVAKTVGNALGTGLCFSLTDIVNYQIANGSLLTRLSMLPAAAAMLLIIPGETGSHPFDAAEAETEICEGMLAEYSGAPLAVYKLSRGPLPGRHRRRGDDPALRPEPGGGRRHRPGARDFDPLFALCGAGRGLRLPASRRHRQAAHRAALQILLDRGHGACCRQRRPRLVRTVRKEWANV